MVNDMNEKIINKDRFEFFKQLERNRTLIKMSLLNKRYERMVIIIGIRMQGKIPFFKIDYSKELRAAVVGVNVGKIRFECNGDSKAFYTFQSAGGEITKGGIWIKFPEVIERIQRRQHFRLNAPLGTKIHFLRNSIENTMLCQNVSEKGVLFSHEKHLQKEPILHPEECLTDLTLVFPEGEKIRIKEAVLKRFFKDHKTSTYRYSIHFTGIDREEQNRLRGLIFQFQRKLLKKI